METQQKTEKSEQPISLQRSFLRVTTLNTP